MIPVVLANSLFPSCLCWGSCLSDLEIGTSVVVYSNVRYAFIVKHLKLLHVYVKQFLVMSELEILIFLLFFINYWFVIHFTFILIIFTPYYAQNNKTIFISSIKLYTRIQNWVCVTRDEWNSRIPSAVIKSYSNVSIWKSGKFDMDISSFQLFFYRALSFILCLILNLYLTSLYL